MHLSAAHLEYKSVSASLLSMCKIGVVWCSTSDGHSGYQIFAIIFPFMTASSSIPTKISSTAFVTASGVVLNCICNTISDGFLMKVVKTIHL